MKFAYRATVATNSFDAAELNLIKDKLISLEGRPLESQTATGVFRMSSQEPKYLVHIDDNWRAIVREEGNEIEVLNVIHRDTLELFRSLSA